MTLGMPGPAKSRSDLRGIIAMYAEPSYLSTPEHSRRWGIEPMFPDFKSRGFGIQDTQIQDPDRLGRLILVVSLALYWALSTGMWDAAEKRIAQSQTCWQHGEGS